MARNTSRYRSAAERLAAGDNSAPGSSGRARSRAGSVWTRFARLRLRREVAVVGAFALAVVVGLGSLGTALYLTKSDHDWASVATVNGHSISREDLRGRMAVLGLLARERVAFLGGVSTAYLPAEQASAIESRAQEATSLTAARESLIEDELLRQLAVRDGIATPASPDPWVEATAYASGDIAHRLRVVRFGLPTTTSPGSASPAPAGSPTQWPIAGQANVDAATTRVRTELAANTSVETIVADLHDAGWQVFGEDVAISTDGVPSDSSLDLDPSISEVASRAEPGDVLGPATDAYGRVSLGKVLDGQDTTMVSRKLPGDADAAKVDTSALQSWANGQALRRAVTASLLAGWRSKGVNEAHFRELVVGAAPDSSGTAGPWVELSMLAVDRLKGTSANTIAGAPAGLDLNAPALAKALTAMSSTDRTALFRSLVAAANKPAGGNSSNISGELGFYTKDGVVPDLGKAAFADTTRSGDVIGPISTAAGPELFLVESRYTGSLDERSQAALRQIRNDLNPNLLTYAQQYSPADVALAAEAGWRAEPEFGSTEAVRGALFDTPVGTLSDPFVLDGKLAVALVSERKTAVPDARTLDRLSMDGYDVWFAAEFAKATITRSDNPLPELATPSPSSTASSSAPVEPSLPVLDTPNLPSIPGQPSATPVPTDALGFPALP
jgi:hypothetical protein